MGVKKALQTRKPYLPAALSPTCEPNICKNKVRQTNLMKIVSKILDSVLTLLVNVAHMPCETYKNSGDRNSGYDDHTLETQ